MIVVLEFDDGVIHSVSESVKSYDIDFYDVLEEALSIGFGALGRNDINQFRVHGLRNRDLDAYRAFSVNVARWLDNMRFLSHSEPPSFIRRDSSPAGAVKPGKRLPAFCKRRGRSSGPDHSLILLCDISESIKYYLTSLFEYATLPE